MQQGDRVALVAQLSVLQTDREGLRRRQDELRGQVKATQAMLQKANADLSAPQYNGVRL